MCFSYTCFEIFDFKPTANVCGNVFGGKILHVTLILSGRNGTKRHFKENIRTA
jgi:hypothetical protein